jgi:sugar lactone lactonase YvrE
VHPDGLAFVASNDLIVANRGSGGTILRIKPDGTTTVFDSLPQEDFCSVAVRSNGDVYVACLSGSVYRYIKGKFRTRLGGYSAGNLSLEFSPDHTILYVSPRETES